MSDDITIDERSPVDAHVEIIKDAITLAATDPGTALTVDVFAALAALSSNPKTSGQYQLLLHDLASAHEAFSKVEIRKQVEACPPITVAANADLRDELRNGVEPWGEQVDGSELAEAIKERIECHCVLPEGAAICITLWLIASYCIDSFRLFPKLLITSPQPRCGKSTLLEVIAAYVPRPLIGSNVSSSVIFRAIEAWRVSILLDEADTFIHGKDELRGIINSGHTRANAFVWRVEGDSINREPVEFSTWAPMVIAMIKTPPDTVLDRSIWCKLQRKAHDRKVDRLPRDLNDVCLELRRKCQRWADDNCDELGTLDPDMPESNNDRAEDNYRTLAAVADLIGDDWPELLRNAFKHAVRSQSSADTEDLSLALLHDIQHILDNRPNNQLIPSSTLVDLLNGMEDRPWPTVTNGEPLTQFQLSRFLKPYDVKPEKGRTSGKQCRGYPPERLREVCKAYLPEKLPSLLENPLRVSQMSQKGSDRRLSGTAEESQGVPSRQPVTSDRQDFCDTVTP